MSESDKGSIDPENVIGYEFEPTEFNYSSRDACLYALGIGFNDDPMNQQELRFTYEGAKNFQVFPTYGINFSFSFLPKISSIPGLKFSRMMLLHGEQYFEQINNLPNEGLVTNIAKVSDVLDKGSGVVLVIDVDCFDNNGDKLIFNQFKVFIRGLGGFGGKRGEAQEEIEIPNRPPDAIEIQKTLSQQALFYRLSGDTNPLHADPQQAEIGGFDRPILHGLCTFGFSTRAVLKNFANYDPNRLQSIQARFSSHVFPGETLKTEMWGNNKKVFFLTKVIERDAIVLKNAYLKLK